MYYFIGIKGTGMAALAVMLHDLGKDASPAWPGLPPCRPR